MLRYVLVAALVDAECIPEYRLIESFASAEQAAATGRTIREHGYDYNVWRVLDNVTGEIVLQGACSR